MLLVLRCNWRILCVVVCGSTEFLRARGMFWLDRTDAVDRGEGNDLLLLRRWSEFDKVGGWCC